MIGMHPTGPMQYARRGGKAKKKNAKRKKKNLTLLALDAFCKSKQVLFLKVSLLLFTGCNMILKVYQQSKLFEDFKLLKSQGDLLRKCNQTSNPHSSASTKTIIPYERGATKTKTRDKRL